MGISARLLLPVAFPTVFMQCYSPICVEKMPIRMNELMEIRNVIGRIISLLFLFLTADHHDVCVALTKTNLAK